MGRYRTINVDLNRQYRNDLNQNFNDIEADIAKAQQDLIRVEAESKERDNLLAGTDVEIIIERIDTSATNAELQSVYAKNQGDYAKTQGDYALEQGNYASSKGDYANEKAALADEAAANANLEASNLSQLKIDVTTATQNANTATDNANIATTSANNAATYSINQGYYAKEQGDAAKQVIENGVVTSVNGQTGDVTVEGFSGDYNDLSNKPDLSQMTTTLLSGTQNFNSTTGTVITHAIGHTNYKVQITPTANPNGYLGEVWVEKAANSFKVCCSGTTLTAFDYVVIE